MTLCRLDVFPVELVYQLLGYFWSHEILQTFSDVSRYLDAVLLAYPWYRMNFKSIRRADFDLVCQRILPNQVISLTLSDDKDTPGQVGLFLSRFQVEQFTHLRSLTVIDVEPDFWEPIASKLTLLKSLYSFFYVSTMATDHCVSDISGDQVTELDKRLFDTYAPVLLQLRRLRLIHGDYLRSTSLPRLRHLILERCCPETLKHICRAAPQLKSLNIYLRDLASNTEYLYPFAHLNRLILQISDARVSMDNMERLLSGLPRLKHLELDVVGEFDLVNGQRWKALTNDLVKFDFIFRQLIGLQSAALDSFRTPFWLETKRWFIAYIKSSLVSVSHFANALADEKFEAPTYSTAPDNIIFYERVVELTLSTVSMNSDHRFTRIQTLELGFFTRLSTFRKSIDLDSVRHLNLPLYPKHFMIEYILNEMPSLLEISIGGNIKNFLQQAQCKPIEKIRILEIGTYFNDNDNCNIARLSCVFPRVEQLRVKYMCEIENMFDFIHQFKHLSSASFLYSPVVHDTEYAQKRRLDLQSSLDQIYRAQNCTYTYRFDRSYLHIWI